MKKTINYFKILAFVYSFITAANVYAQSCTHTINITTYPMGYYTFWATQSASLAGNSYYGWDYGDGNTYNYSAANQNMGNHTYSSNGTYTVIFTYSNAATSCSFTSSQVVTVNTASCTLTAYGTVTSALNTFTFASTSTGTTPTTTYSWDFGDGNTANGETVVHTYTTNGNFSPTLTVGEPAMPACNSVTYLYASACTQTANILSTTAANGLVSFTCASSLSNSTTIYYWNFGNGVTSTGTTSIVSHNYLANGVYNLILGAADGGCSLTIPYSHTVSNVTAPCGVNAIFVGYSPISSTNHVFYNYSTNTVVTTTYSWDFGDGNSSTAIAPTHTYASPGTYTVTLLADNNYSYTCTDTQSIVLVVQNCYYTPSFSTTQGVSGAVYFSSDAASSMSTTVTWSFGDGSSDVMSPTASHTYAANGSYTVTILGIYTAWISACSNTLTTVVTITNICTADASFSVVPTATAQVWDVIPTYPGNVASATWDWGDGSSSNTLFSSHSYSAAGIYTLCLTVTTTCGAVDSYCSGYSIYKSATDEDQTMIEVKVVDYSTVGIKTNSAENIHMVIAPNPNRGAFQLSLSGIKTNYATITIYNLVGQIIYEKEAEVLNGTIKTELQLDATHDGVYFIKTSAGQQTLIKKIVISRN